MRSHALLESIDTGENEKEEDAKFDDRDDGDIRHREDDEDVSDGDIDNGTDDDDDDQGSPDL